MVWVIRAIILTMALSIADCANVHSQYDCNFMQNAYGQRVSWHGSVPVILYVHKSFPISNLKALYAAVNQWNTAMNKEMIVIAGTANGDDIPKRDGISVIYWLDYWESNLYNQEARTTIYWYGDQIQEADVRVNAKNYKYSLDTPNSSSIDLESLLVHELGHVLGLKHDLIPGSVMNPYLLSGVERRNPSQFDLSSLSCEY